MDQNILCKLCIPKTSLSLGENPGSLGLQNTFASMWIIRKLTSILKHASNSFRFSKLMNVTFVLKI